jgi:hypothetical protein
MDIVELKDLLEAEPVCQYPRTNRFSLFEMFASEIGFPINEQTVCFWGTSLHGGFRLPEKVQKTTKRTDIRTHNAHVGWDFILAIPAI